MHVSPFILSSDQGLIKLAIFVVVAIIWGISGLASAAKKASEQAKRRAALQPRVSPPAAQKLASPAPQRKPPAPPRRPPPPPRAPAGIDRFALPPAQPIPALPAARPAGTPTVAASRRDATTLAQRGVSPVAVRVEPHGANSSAIRQWLRPGSLRKQFILTELLQPPMALRQTHETRADDSQQRHRDR